MSEIHKNGLKELGRRLCTTVNVVFQYSCCVILSQYTLFAKPMYPQKLLKSEYRFQVQPFYRLVLLQH